MLVPSALETPRWKPGDKKKMTYPWPSEASPGSVVENSCWNTFEMPHNLTHTTEPQEACTNVRKYICGSVTTKLNLIPWSNIFTLISTPIYCYLFCCDKLKRTTFLPDRTLMSQHPCMILTQHLPRSLCAFLSRRLPWIILRTDCQIRLTVARLGLPVASDITCWETQIRTEDKMRGILLDWVHPHLLWGWTDLINCTAVTVRNDS